VGAFLGHLKGASRISHFRMGRGIHILSGEISLSPMTPQ